jgi:serine/threonine protein kinase
LQDLEEKKLDKNDIVFEKDADGDLVELGKGSMGTVYSGQYLNSAVAVKKIDVSGLPIAAAAKELKMYSLLTHPKVIKLFGHYTNKSYLYLVLELGGNNLRALLEAHSATRLSFSITLTFALHISEGVMYLHGQDIIHLDIKSSNVIICNGNIAKITDLGSARKMITTSTQSTIGKAGRGRYNVQEYCFEQCYCLILFYCRV